MERKPYLIGLAGDSASGKATFTQGVRELLGPEDVTWISEDDYHCFDRAERKRRKVTPLQPEANALSLMERHYRMLARGETILKPVYDHSCGSFDRPVLVRPTPIVLLTGLLPFATEGLREALDLTLYLDTHPDLKRAWKVGRDTSKRGHRLDDLLAEMAGRIPHFRAHVEPQKLEAGIVITQEPDGSDEHVRTRVSLRLGPASSLAAHIRGEGRTVRMERWGRQPKVREVVEARSSVDPEEVEGLFDLVPNPPDPDGPLTGSQVAQLCIAAQVALAAPRFGHLVESPELQAAR